MYRAVALFFPRRWLKLQIHFCLQSWTYIQEILTKYSSRRNLKFETFRCLKSKNSFYLFYFWLFNSINLEETKNYVETNWQLNSTSMTNYNFVTRKQFFNMSCDRLWELVEDHLRYYCQNRRKFSNWMSTSTIK